MTALDQTLAALQASYAQNRDALVAEQLEYLLERRKRDPDAMLAAFADEIAAYKTQLKEAAVPVNQEQLDDKLAQVITPEPAKSERVYLYGSFGLHLRLRYVGFQSMYYGNGKMSAPARYQEEAQRVSELYTADPAVDRLIGRKLCGLPL